jgi:hypothetical protein
VTFLSGVHADGLHNIKQTSTILYNKAAMRIGFYEIWLFWSRGTIYIDPKKKNSNVLRCDSKEMLSHHSTE